MKRWKNIKTSLPPLFLFLIFIMTWELVSYLIQIPAYILPAPSVISRSLLANVNLLAHHAGTTLTAVAGGMVLAIFTAILLAIAMDRWKSLKQALYPILVVSQAVPIFALAPLMMIWFGVGLTPKILIVALVCFFPLAVNLVEGFSQVDPEATDLLKIMQADKWMIMKSVQLPTAMPYFFSGLKIAATYSVLGAIIGEWLGARSGLGIYMLRAMNSFRTGDVFASIAVVILLSLTLFKIVESSGRLAMPWKKETLNHKEER